MPRTGSRNVGLGASPAAVSRHTLVILAAAVVCLSAATTGCDRDDDSPETTEEVTEEADEAESQQQLPDGAVAYGGDVEVTIDDVVDAVERLRLVAPGAEDGELPSHEPEWMKQPQAQLNVLRNLVHFAVVRAAADERDIEVSDDEIQELVEDHSQLRRYLPLFDDTDGAEELREQLAEFGLDADDVRHLAVDMALDERLKDHLAEEFPDDKLWGIYQQSRDTADVVAVKLHNTPNSAEIDRAVSQYDAEIRSHFRENRDRYVSPPRADVAIVRQQRGAEPDTDRLEEAAERLDAGEDLDRIADDLELTAEHDVTVSRHEAPSAHDDADIGDTGVVLDTRRGPYAWRLMEYHPPERRSLDRPLKREIASRILREQEGITPANRQRAQQARDILADADTGEPLDGEAIEKLVAELEDQGFEAIHTDEFSLHHAGVVPELGLAEELIEALKERDLDDPVTEPILERNTVFVARLVDRGYPDREQFEENRDEFRTEFLERNRDRLVEDFVRQYQGEHDLQMSVGPIAEHFGVIEQKRR